MRTRAAVASAFASLSVLAIGWQVGAGVLQSQTVIATTTSTPTSTTPSTTTPSATPTPTATAASGAADGTYTGSAYSTRWGDVQVSVTISGGAITDVAALQLTNADGKSVQISNRAAPILQQEVIASQSANVSFVSGGTYTSQAYLSSVQSALDQAGFTG